MKSAWTIAAVSIKENFRNRTVYFIFAAALFFILAGRGCSGSLTTNSALPVETIIGAPEILAMQIAYHVIVFWALVLCSLLSMGALSKEIEQGTIIMTLARPVSRPVFAAGKLISVLLISILNLFLLGAIFVVLFYIKAGFFNLNIFLSFSLAGLSLLLLSITGMLLSLFVPRIIVPVISFAIYFMSVFTEMPHYFEFFQRFGGPSAHSSTLRTILPRFGEIQFLGASLISSSASAADCLIPAVNIIIFSAVCWGIMMFVFARKEL